MVAKLKSCGLPIKYCHVVGLLISFISPLDGKAASPDRLVSLMQAARGSSCFLSPSRPATTESLPSSVVGAAFQGEASAMYRLAETYLGDQLSGPSGKQALPWFERAATAGHVAAAADAGRIFAAGRGMPADPKQAFAWWMFGATRGDLRSMACVSVSYLLGHGVPVDTVEAARWAILRDAASTGQSLLSPSAADMERALPVSEMLAARRRATEMLEPTPPPGRDAPLPGAATIGVPQFIPGFPATWPPVVPASLPRMPPTIPAGLSGSAGTGVVIAAPGVVITAAHVVRGCGFLVVRAGAAEFGGSDVLAVNNLLDLALLNVPGLMRNPIPVVSTTRLGTEVVVLGYPEGGVQTDRLTATFGNVSAIGAGPEIDLVQFTAPIQPGNSGGPLIDRQGRLTGIAIARNEVRQELLAGLKPTQNVNYAAAPSAVHRFLTDHALPLNTAAAAHLDVTQLVEQVERSVVRIMCFKPTAAQVSATAKPPSVSAMSQDQR